MSSAASSNSIYIENLPDLVTKTQLLEAFHKLAPKIDSIYVRNKNDNKSIAFLNFNESIKYSEICSEYSGCKIDGIPFHIGRVNPKRLNGSKPSDSASHSTRPEKNQNGWRKEESEAHRVLKLSAKAHFTFFDQSSLTFYAMYNDDIAPMQDLLCKLESVAQTAEIAPVVNAVKGQLYCALYDDDGDGSSSWYRCRILDIYPPNSSSKAADNQYLIHFIDFGNKRIVGIDSLLDLPLELQELRPLAHEFEFLDSDKCNKEDEALDSTNDYSRLKTMLSEDPELRQRIIDCTFEKFDGPLTLRNVSSPNNLLSAPFSCQCFFQGKNIADIWMSQCFDSNKTGELAAAAASSETKNTSPDAIHNAQCFDFQTSDKNHKVEASFWTDSDAASVSKLDNDVDEEEWRRVEVKSDHVAARTPAKVLKQLSVSPPLLKDHHNTLESPVAAVDINSYDEMYRVKLEKDIQKLQKENMEIRQSLEDIKLEKQNMIIDEVKKKKSSFENSLRIVDRHIGDLVKRYYNLESESKLFQNRENISIFMTVIDYIGDASKCLENINHFLNSKFSQNFKRKSISEFEKVVENSSELKEVSSFVTQICDSISPCKTDNSDRFDTILSEFEHLKTLGNELKKSDIPSSFIAESREDDNTEIIRTKEQLIWQKNELIVRIFDNLFEFINFDQFRMLRQMSDKLNGYKTFLNQILDLRNTNNTSRHPNKILNSKQDLEEFKKYLQMQLEDDDLWNQCALLSPNTESCFIQINDMLQSFFKIQNPTDCKAEYTDANCSEICNLISSLEKQLVADEARRREFDVEFQKIISGLKTIDKEIDCMIELSEKQLLKFQKATDMTLSMQLFLERSSSAGGNSNECDDLSSKETISFRIKHPELLSKVTEQCDKIRRFNAEKFLPNLIAQQLYHASDVKEESCNEKFAQLDTLRADLDLLYEHLHEKLDQILDKDLIHYFPEFMDSEKLVGTYLDSKGFLQKRHFNQFILKKKVNGKTWQINMPASKLHGSLLRRVVCQDDYQIQILFELLQKWNTLDKKSFMHLKLSFIDKDTYSIYYLFDDHQKSLMSLIESTKHSAGSESLFEIFKRIYADQNMPNTFERGHFLLAIASLYRGLDSLHAKSMLYLELVPDKIIVCSKHDNATNILPLRLMFGTPAFDQQLQPMQRRMLLTTTQHFYTGTYSYSFISLNLDRSFDLQCMCHLLAATLPPSPLPIDYGAKLKHTASQNAHGREKQSFEKRLILKLYKATFTAASAAVPDAQTLAEIIEHYA
ncbi:MAG: nuclease domain-containing protein [Marteilia pararefringens]